MKNRDDCVLGSLCWIGKTKATIVGYMEWKGKLQYVWVKFQEVEELIRPQKVRLI